MMKDKIIPVKRQTKMKENNLFSNTNYNFLMAIVICIFCKNTINAQLSASGQVRTRTELRAGQGTLQKEGEKAALFTSQRTRLNIGYSGYRFNLYTSLQDVRVWGQDASSINRITAETKNGNLLNEAWGEIILNDTTSTIKNLSLKIGRQPISYDDQKILGALDWLQQGRRHDAAIFKFANNGWIADLGVAFNQNQELNTGTVYNGTNPLYPAGTNGIGTLYKSFQYLYVDKKFTFGDISFLYFKDDFNKYSNVTTGTPPVTNKVYETGVWSRNTTGFYFNVMPLRILNLTGNVYHQNGRDKDGKKISASLASITSTLQIGRKLFVGPGFDYLSGDTSTKIENATSTNYRFDPLYGTPHKFWGYMDYFYVANGFGKQGLLNYFLKAKYNVRDNLSLFLDIHGFEAGNKIVDATGVELNRYLGTEIDFLVKYNLTKTINFEAGYSFMKATSTMASPFIKGVITPNLSPQFAYLMINITPNFTQKK
jgi:hypothetical protein